MKIFRLFAILLGVFLCSGCGKPHDARPNILFILSDDQRWDTIGALGNASILTPGLDRLAREGIVFDNAFVTTAVCAVSRASILLGQYARKTGIEHFHHSLSSAQWKQSYPLLLKGAGYEIGFIGKFGVGAESLDKLEVSARKFDYWAGFSHQGNYWHQATCAYVTSNGVCDCPGPEGQAGYIPRTGKDRQVNPLNLSHEILPAKVEQFLAGRDRSKPFCLSVSLKAPHGPWKDVPPELEGIYDNKPPIAVRPNVDLASAEKMPAFLRESLDSDRGLAYCRNPKELQRWMRDYYQMVSAVDLSVKLIRDLLTKYQLDSNTVVIFASDNGHLLGEHGLFGKWLAYEESIRVPLIIYDPRNRAHSGEHRGQMALNIDLAPTMLDLAGVTVPDAMQGKSLLPLLNGPNPKGSFREDWFYEHHFTAPKPNAIERSEGVRTEGWKYIRYFDQNPVVEQLFDLKADPYEMTDLSGQPSAQEMLQRLRVRWETYFQK